MITPSTFEFTTVNEYGDPVSNIHRAHTTGDYRFSPDLWVSAIGQMSEAQSISDYAQAFGGLALSLASFNQRYFFEGGHNTIEVKPPVDIELSARYQYDVRPDGVIQLGRMKSIKPNGLTIGLIRVVPGKNSAFAVVDEVKLNGSGKRKTVLHEVYRDPSDAASTRIMVAGSAVVAQTSTYLHSRYPGLELLSKLESAGIKP